MVTRMLLKRALSSLGFLDDAELVEEVGELLQYEVLLLTRVMSVSESRFECPDGFGPQWLAKGCFHSREWYKGCRSGMAVSLAF